MTPPGDDPNEVWADVPDFEHYMVSTHGRVWSRPRHRTKGGILKQGKVERANSRWPTDPYWQVGLRNGGKRKYWYIHRLVLAVFVRPPTKGEEAHHRDDDTSNNHVNNLEWVTHAQNLKYRDGMDTHDPESDDAHYNIQIDGVPF